MPLADDAPEGYREWLEAQRDDLARRLDEAENKDAAALHRQLTAVLERLDKLPTGREVSKLDTIAETVGDELAARRDDRKPDTKGASRTRGGRKAGS